MPVIVTTNLDERVAFDEEPLPVVQGWRFISRRYTACEASRRANYRDLFISCDEESLEFRKGLLSGGHRMYLFFVGPRIKGRSTRLPGYELSSPIVSTGINIVDCIEVDKADDAADRLIGLYEIGDQDFANCCYLLSMQPWSILLFSKRDIKSRVDLDGMYLSVTRDFDQVESYYPSLAMDWGSLSKALCPLGDIIVKTSGRFDDKERAVAFIQAARGIG